MRLFPASTVRFVYRRLDLEGHGGLYILHSHLNHSCTPNVSVRHLHQSTNLSRISLVTKRDIAAGKRPWDMNLVNSV